MLLDQITNRLFFTNVCPFKLQMSGQINTSLNSKSTQEAAMTEIYHLLGCVPTGLQWNGQFDSEDSFQLVLWSIGKAEKRAMSMLATDN